MKILPALAELNSETIISTKDGVIQGFIPANHLFGYTYHGNSIPPFKPDHMLMLGYNVGTVAELTRKIWGLDVKITGVDIEFPNPPPYHEYKLVCKDAFQFVLNEAHQQIKTMYDYIFIDLWKGSNECEFVFDQRFAECVNALCTRLVSINVNHYSVDKLKPYYQIFRFSRIAIAGDQRVLYWGK